MRKLLSLMSILAISTTTVSSVIACSNENPPLYNFTKSKETLSDGTINVLGETISADAKKLPSDTIANIKNAIIIRLQYGTKENNYTNLKPTDFKLTIKSQDEKTNSVFIENDVIKNEKGFIEQVKKGETPHFTFELIPTKGTKVTFNNTMCIREYMNVTPAWLLKEHNSIDNPAHLFIKPSEVNQTNFKEVFWNSVLGEPALFEKQKDNFNVSITDSELNKLNKLVTDNTATAEINLTFTINKDFKTIQTGFSFKKDATVTAGMKFKTKLPCFDFSQITDKLQKDSFNITVNKGKDKLAAATKFIKEDILKQSKELAKAQGLDLTLKDFTISIDGLLTMISPFSMSPLYDTINFVYNDQESPITSYTDKLFILFNRDTFENLNCVITITPVIGKAVTFYHVLNIKEKHLLG